MLKRVFSMLQWSELQIETDSNQGLGVIKLF